MPVWIISPSVRVCRNRSIFVSGVKRTLWLWALRWKQVSTVHLNWLWNYETSLNKSLCPSVCNCFPPWPRLLVLMRHNLPVSICLCIFFTMSLFCAYQVSVILLLKPIGAVLWITVNERLYSEYLRNPCFCEALHFFINQVSYFLCVLCASGIL